MRTSLQFRLSASISLAVVVIAGSAAAYTFSAAMREAHLAQDKQLRQTAHAISRLQTGPVTLAGWRKIKGIGDEERLVVRFLGSRAGTEYHRAPLFSSAMPDGLQTVRVGAEAWRVYVRSSDDGVRLAVAQQTAVRDAAAARNALRSLAPFALLVLLLPLLVHVLVRRLFGPLRALAADVRRRGHGDLGQLDPAGLPDEVQPFVAEINRLLMRIDRAMHAQRRFIADAAHELRSPLTALGLQSERLAAAEMPPEARRRMAVLADGLERTRLLLDQLLALARSQQGGAGAGTARVALSQAIREVIEDLYPLAEERAIDLGVVGADDAWVALDALDLRMLVKNLVDNAIRYSPPGGRVDVAVRCRGDGVDLVVDDAGPGIPESERDRVFDAFYRVLGNGEASGSGLGLAIVKAVADRAGASVTLGAAPAPARGLRVVVAFPAVLPAVLPTAPPAAVAAPR